MMTTARIAVWLGLNLNWVFDPVTAWGRGEPLLMRRIGARER